MTQLTACGPPIRHMVKPGETLYSIGLWYDLDYRDIAEWNDLSAPYRLKNGQMLRLAPSQKPWWEDLEQQTGSVQSNNVASSENKTNEPQNRARDPQTTKTKPIPRTALRDSVTDVDTSVQWQWPTSGDVVDRFTTEGKGNKGVNIAGKRGQPIYAAADGEVVYSGSGLVGLGKLIIIKHNRTYLSAYAHNEDLVVQEGVKVVKGQQIATMGNSGIERVLLHFEIRRNGKPIDPFRVLAPSS